MRSARSRSGSGFTRLATAPTFGELGNELARAVDYAAVCEEMRRVSEREDKLIETLAHETAEHLLRTFDLLRIELELRKFILSGTRYVAARVVRAL